MIWQKKIVDENQLAFDGKSVRDFLQYRGTSTQIILVDLSAEKFKPYTLCKLINTK